MSSRNILNLSATSIYWREKHLGNRKLHLSGRGNSVLANKFVKCKSSHQRCSVKKGVLRSFQKFRKIHRKTPVLKKSLWHRCFSVSFAKFLRTAFLQNISGRLILKIFTVILDDSSCVRIFKQSMDGLSKYIHLE